MKHLHMILPFVMASLLAACYEIETPPLPDGVSAFREDFLSLSVDADKAYSDRPVTFAVGCTPIVNGKGRIWFNISGDYPRSQIHIESPVIATLVRDSNFFIPIPAMFVANRPFKMPIRCRFQPGNSYFYYVVATLDSVFVADSNRYYEPNSEIAQRFRPKGGGYYTQLSNRGGTLALYAP
jgi:hypothetical protein